MRKHERFRIDWTADEAGQGWLCVVYSDTEFSNPVRVSHWWPCFQMSETEAKDIYEVPVAALDGGNNTTFNFKVRGFWKSVNLKDGGKTQPIRTDREEVPKPKTRVETRYRDGGWEKYLKTKGWVPA